MSQINLCARNGKPITNRRYNHVWDRLGRYLPWVTTLNVSAHWIRHTTLTWVDRNFSYATATPTPSCLWTLSGSTPNGQIPRPAIRRSATDWARRAGLVRSAYATKNPSRTPVSMEG
jgi:hypothetical protein